MAVLKIVPKLYQEKISEKLKEEISLVTNGEAKYYNRLYKFFQYTDIQCTADINYETRKMYMDSLEKEDISEKYKVELMSLFDRLKIENIPDVYSHGNPFSVEQEFFKQKLYYLTKQFYILHFLLLPSWYWIHDTLPEPSFFQNQYLRYNGFPEFPLI